MATTERVGMRRLLRVAQPRECNTQQTPQNRATARATGAQQGSLRALAGAALARNSARNTGAQDAPETAQQRHDLEAAIVARDSTPLRVACVAFPRGATTQQPEKVVRVVVRFRLQGGCPRSWCTAIGTKPREAIVEELRILHGAGVEVLP